MKFPIMYENSRVPVWLSKISPINVWANSFAFWVGVCRFHFYFFGQARLRACRWAAACRAGPCRGTAAASTSGTHLRRLPSRLPRGSPAHNHPQHVAFLSLRQGGHGAHAHSTGSPYKYSFQLLYAKSVVEQLVVVPRRANYLIWKATKILQWRSRARSSAV